MIIVTEAYSANLTAFLTVERIPEGINTLKDLYQSSLPIYAQGPFFGNNLAAAKNDYARVRGYIFPKLNVYIKEVISYPIINFSCYNIESKESGISESQRDCNGLLVANYLYVTEFTTKKPWKGNAFFQQ